IYGLQTEIGIPAANQTGSVGPATRAGLPILREGNSGQFVKLFQYALYFNNFDSSPFTGVYSSKVRYEVLEFQNFTLLSPSGTVDLQTWLSVLLSTGDPDRKGTACDGITEVTPERAQTLKDNGYKAIGRYLVNVPGGLNKKIQPGELQTIFATGMSVYPIYQTFGNKTSYFNYDQGAADAIEAYNAAKNYGFKNETIIYFAVDFDAYGADITNAIVPYFRGVNSQFIKLGAPYRVGVYGARNVCIQVSERGLATTSFVSGMSTGFSGNLGYPLPSNWAFDQISTKTFGTGNGRIEIDNNIMNGKDPGQTSVGGTLSPLNQEAMNELKIIYDLAMEYTGRVRPRANYLVANYYKKESYANDLWAYVSGGIVVDFVDYVKVNYKDVTEFKNLIDPVSRKVIGIEHLMATLSAELYFPDVPIIGNHVKGFAGWAGDMVSVMIDVHRERSDDSFDSTYDASVDHIGAKTKVSNFSYDDYMADIDAVNIGKNLYNPALSITEAFTNYYEKGEVMTRFSDFYQSMFKSKKEDAQSSAEVYLNSTSLLHTDIKVFREMFISHFKVPEYTEEDGIAVAKAWSERISFDAMNE
ncbi:MAG TPA: glycoside hydrolase domain-containing protein, partial [Sporosarcina sp.]|nr:glycoside hydrolase domain-containing protein [Sporosarcina sp.]